MVGMDSSNPKKYIRVAQVESSHGIKSGVLYELIRAGKIRTVRVGVKENATRGTRLIDVESLEQYLAARATGGAS